MEKKNKIPVLFLTADEAETRYYQKVLNDRVKLYPVYLVPISTFAASIYVVIEEMKHRGVNKPGLFIVNLCAFDNPRMGIASIGEIRKKYTDVPIIVWAGDKHKDWKKETLKLGANEFLGEDASEADLKEKTLSLLD